MIRYYSGEIIPILSKKYFDIMSSTVLLQLNFFYGSSFFTMLKSIIQTINN